MSSHVNSCHGDYPFISHIVSSGVHMCCPVKPWNAMSSHDNPCQVMSSHVMAIIPSFLILSAQVCTLWRFSPRFSYCQLRCALCGNFPLVSHIVSSGVHMCCPVKPWNAMSSHDNPCQVMSSHVMAIIPSFLILSAQVCTLWRFSPRFSYCQLRCALCGNFPLVSHIVSSGVHFNLKKKTKPRIGVQRSRARV